MHTNTNHEAGDTAGIFMPTDLPDQRVHHDGASSDVPPETDLAINGMVRYRQFIMRSMFRSE